MALGIVGNRMFVFQLAAGGRHGMALGLLLLGGVAAQMAGRVPETGRPPALEPDGAPVMVAGSPALVDVGALLDKGREYLDRELWSAASDMFDRILLVDPEHAEARSQRQRARREQDNEKRYQRVLQDADDGQWSDAYFELVGFPVDSVYHERLAQQATRIEQGLAESELARGRRLVEQRDLDGARQVQVALARKPFAEVQAGQLAAAIAEQVNLEAPPNEEACALRQWDTAPPPGRPASPLEDHEYQALLQDGLSAIARGQREKAFDLLARAQQLRPDHHVPHQRLCAISKPMGRLGEALAHCRQWLAMESNPTYQSHIRKMIDSIEQELGCKR